MGQMIGIEEKYRRAIERLADAETVVKAAQALMFASEINDYDMRIPMSFLRGQVNVYERKYLANPG